MEIFEELAKNPLSTLFAALTGAIIFWGTYRIYKIKVKHQNILTELSQSQLELVNREQDIRKEALTYINDATADISNAIAQKLSNDPKWLDRFMDETGATFSGSVFGQRIRHFHFEKEWLAAMALDEIEKLLIASEDKKICLLIDSGTTTYPIFHEISNRLKNLALRNLWHNRVFIATNSLPGVQYLMKNCRSDKHDPYSDLGIECLLLPGKPLAIYAALAGSATVAAIHRLEIHLRGALNWRRENYQIIGFVTGNYFTRENDGIATRFLPVARGEGHHEVKDAIVKKSDKVYLLAPLMKFSCASVKQLNQVCGFHIDPTFNPGLALKDPQKVMYKAVDVPIEKCQFFTTQRQDGNIFTRFSQNLKDELIDIYGKTAVTMVEFKLSRWLPNVDGHVDVQTELKYEIPHQSMMEKYLRVMKEKNLQFIWNNEWVREYTDL